MSSIQIASLIYFTVIVICAWIFFGFIFLQLKNFMSLSHPVKIISKILTVGLITLTVIGYIMMLIPDFFKLDNSPTPARPDGYFDTY